MKIHLLRHSTTIITIGGFNVLIDPMFAPAGSTDAIANTPNPRRNPLLDLPFSENRTLEMVKKVDGVIVTHTHNDHWDQKARELLPKSLPLFCQPEDYSKIQEAGFKAVHSVDDTFEWGPLQLLRTGGQHGRGKIGRLMAPVSGFVLRASGEPVLYIAGDTLWCEEVEEAIEVHSPEVIVVNAGAAQFTSGGPITMTADDVIKVSNANPNGVVIAVHMEAINHCLLGREDLKETLVAAGIASRVQVPEDGEQITISP